MSKTIQGALVAIVLGLAFITVGLMSLNALEWFGTITAIAAIFGSTAQHEVGRND